MLNVTTAILNVLMFKLTARKAIGTMRLTGQIQHFYVHMQHSVRLVLITHCRVMYKCNILVKIQDMFMEDLSHNCTS